jgi:hypothetical protein
MKKSFAICHLPFAICHLPLTFALAAASFSSVAGPNFNSGTGVLVMPDVSVDGTSFYDSVTLKLDFNTGKFILVAYTPKNTKISDTPLQTFSANSFTVDFLGCARTGTNQIACHTNVTNTKNDTYLTFYGGSGICGTHSTLYDNLGNPYSPSVAVFNQTSNNYIGGNMLQGVPVRAVFSFSNIDTHATSIAAFEPLFANGCGASLFQAIFKNITF